MNIKSAAALLTLALALAISHTAAQAEGQMQALNSYTAWNTYQLPPFVVDKGKSLGQALVERLNDKLMPAYSLKLENTPRARFDMTELVKGDRFDGVTLFLNPRFVGDNDESKFLWSKPLFKDCNLIISSKMKPISFEGKQSLVGLKFGGVIGNKYVYIDDLAAENKLTREDVREESLNLSKVASGRLDFTLMPYTIFSYLSLADKETSQKLFISPKAHLCFTRHIMVGKMNSVLLKAINEAIDGLMTDPEWLNSLAQLNMDVGVLSKIATPHP